MTHDCHQASDLCDPITKTLRTLYTIVHKDPKNVQCHVSEEETICHNYQSNES